jgi:hypothetical protein
LYLQITRWGSIQNSEDSMAKKLVVLGVAAAAMLMASSAFDAADARRGGGHSFSGGGWRGGHAMGLRSFSGGAVHRFHGHAFRHHRHFRHRHLFVTAPLVYGYYGYDDCGWLRRRAVYTGSAYWWDRYNACLYGYGY